MSHIDIVEASKFAVNILQSSMDVAMKHFSGIQHSHVYSIQYKNEFSPVTELIRKLKQ